MSAQAAAPQRNAPTAQAGNAPLHVHADLVYVPVTVTDAEGQPVAGLQSKDFLVTENGHPQAIRLFERPSFRQLSVVLAMDTSLSVHKDLAREKLAAREFVRALLRPNDELELTGFAGQVREYVPFTGDAGRIERALNHLHGDGPTALYAAVVRGSQLLASQPGRRVLVVLSDGANSMPGTDYDQARTAALRAQVSIESVILVPIAANAGRNLGGEHALIQLSRDTGGKYFYVRGASQLRHVLEQLSQSLHNEYLLGYYAPAQRAAGKPAASNFRRIQVKVTDASRGGGLQLDFRSGYYVDPKH
ncbi:MAG: VWA domain-containing protein [Acidobacteriaceae bacterium]